MLAQIDRTYLRTSPLKSLCRLFIYTFVEGRPLTTRGRWINPLLFIQFAFLKRVPQLKKVQCPIYILGTGRNGSTLLGKLLSLHPSVCFLNEPKALWHAFYPFDDVVGSYSTLPATFRLQTGDVSKEISNTVHRLYAFALRATGSERILDKNAESIFRISFIKTMFPDACFLFLIRNGYDVISSIEHWSWAHGNIDKDGMVNDWWGKNQRKWDIMVDELIGDDEDLGPFSHEIKAFNSQKNRAAVEWILTAKAGLKLLREGNNHAYLIRYEDLLKSPDRSLKDIFKFCSLSNDKKSFQYFRTIHRRPRNWDPAVISPILVPVFNHMMHEFGYK